MSRPMSSMLDENNDFEQVQSASESKTKQVRPRVSSSTHPPPPPRPQDNTDSAASFISTDDMDVVVSEDTSHTPDHKTLTPKTMRGEDKKSSSPGRKPSSVPDDVEYVTIKKFPAELMRRVKASESRVNLSNADALALEVIASQRITTKEATQILKNKERAIDALSAERACIEQEEGLRDWARLLSQKVDNLEKLLYEVLLSSLYGTLNYANCVDDKNVEGRISFESEGVLGILDKLESQASRTRKKRRIKHGRLKS